MGSETMLDRDIATRWIECYSALGRSTTSFLVPLWVSGITVTFDMNYRSTSCNKSVDEFI